MTGPTAVHRALEYVDEERVTVADRRTAFETFERRVRAVPAVRPDSVRPQQTVTAAATTMATDIDWVPALKSAVLEAVSTRRREVESLQEILRRERSTFETAIEEVNEIVDWLQATADESLLQCDFDALQAKHERFEAYRDRLETSIERRQAQFTESTNRYGPGGTSTDPWSNRFTRTVRFDIRCCRP